MSDKLQKTQLKAMDIVKERQKQLKAIFPEVFKEGQINFDHLQRVLGQWIDPGKESFGLTWSGKVECMKMIQSPATGTLRPCKAESLHWDTTENLFIKGENLEVLKLLQKSYLGCIKMIYIDPPYNTGKEFIYPDKYSDHLDNYLKYTGQKDGNGNGFSTNVESNGRFHSKWLNMMYSRLYTARSFLRKDGMIFISIDDHEVHHLRALCDEIFGEENFITQCAWRKTDNQANIGNIARVKEYIIGYAKDMERLSLKKMRLTERAKKEYRYSDKKGEFRRDILLHKTRGKYTYEVKTPSGKILNGPWMKKKDDFRIMDKEDKIYWTKGGQEQPYGKIYLQESEGQLANDFLNIEYGTNQQASLELNKIFNARYFDFPKPTSLIKHFITISTEKNDIVMDFFAGSGTTADAVMQLNTEDGLNRKYICVQLPERCPPKSEAFKAGYKNIADIAQERICRVANTLQKEQKHQKVDLGFRVFKLDKSCYIYPWDDTWHEDKQLLIEQLRQQANCLDPQASKWDFLYEFLIKAGISPVESIEVSEFQGLKIYSLRDRTYLIFLDKIPSKDWIQDFSYEIKDACKLVFIDHLCFQEDEELKVNAELVFQSQADDKEFDIEIILI